MSGSLERRVASGIAWMTGGRAAVRVIGLASTLLLARLLAPADFGLIAMATAVAAGLELLTLFGFDTALIQQKQLRREHYDSAWSLNLLLGAGLCVALLALAIPIASFYRDPRLQMVVCVLAAKYLIEFTANPGVVDFRRNLDFRPEFRLQVIPKLVAVFVTIPLAFWLRDYRALLAGMLASALATWTMSYAMHPHRPRWCVAEALGLYRFSRWLLLNNFVNFVRTRSSDFIIGRALGAAPLGNFTVAFEIANLPSTELVAPINRVLFPGYVELIGDPAALRKAFRITLGLVALVALPAGIGLAAVADPLVRVVLGDQWLATIPLMALLAMAGAVSALQSNTGALHNALGQPRMVLLTGLLHVLTLLPVLIYATWRFGLDGTAWTLLAHGLLIGFPTTYLIVLRTTPVQAADILAACWRPAVACVAMFVVVRAFLDAFPAQATVPQLALKLFTACAIGALVYSAAIALLWWLAGRPAGTENYIIARNARLTAWLGKPKS